MMVAKLHAEGDARRADAAARGERHHQGRGASRRAWPPCIAATSVLYGAPALAVIDLERWWMFAAVALPGAGSGPLIARGHLGILGGTMLTSLSPAVRDGIAVALAGILVMHGTNWRQMDRLARASGMRRRWLCKNAGLEHQHDRPLPCRRHHPRP
jgi:hypothetical protein